MKIEFIFAPFISIVACWNGGLVSSILWGLSWWWLEWVWWSMCWIMLEAGLSVQSDGLEAFKTALTCSFRTTNSHTDLQPSETRFVCVCACVCVRACVRVCVRACVSANTSVTSASLDLLWVKFHVLFSMCVFSVTQTHTLIDIRH